MRKLLLFFVFSVYTLFVFMAWSVADSPLWGLGVAVVSGPLLYWLLVRSPVLVLCVGGPVGLYAIGTLDVFGPAVVAGLIVFVAMIGAIIGIIKLVVLKRADQLDPLRKSNNISGVDDDIFDITSSYLHGNIYNEELK